MKMKTLLTSIGLGAGLMYFYDPQRGNQRRAQIRDKAYSVVNRADDSIDVATRDLRNRARGVLAELTARLDDRGAPDWILEERVRARMGRMLRRPGALQIQADGGQIILSGPVLRSEVDELTKIASRTPGVHGVQNRMEAVDDPGDIPGLQGMPSRQRALPEWQQANWSPAMRLLAGVGGGVLTLYGMTRRGLVGAAASTTGLLMAARSVTNLDPRSMLGVGMGNQAIRVNKAINIQAPIDEVYRFWANFENFPLFMNHVEDIQVQDGMSKWHVAGPAGSQVEFEAHTTRNIPNQMIAWETAPDSQVHHNGTVRFDENPDGSTRVTVHMNYVPPAGALGHAVAKLFGVDPRQAMHDDLVRLKSLIEQGKTSTDETVVELTERMGAD